MRLGKSTGGGWVGGGMIPTVMVGERSTLLIELHANSPTKSQTQVIF